MKIKHKNFEDELDHNKHEKNRLVTALEEKENRWNRILR